MKSFIAALRSLVLPLGATTGARIVLDGVNGSIQVYDAANNLIGVLDGTGFTVTGANHKVIIDGNGNLTVKAVPDNGARIVLTTAPGFGGIIQMTPENSTVAGVTFTQANIFPDSEETVTSSRPLTAFTSPAIDGAPPLQKARLDLYGQASDSVDDDSYVKFTAGRGIYWNDYNVDSGRGFVVGNGLTVSSAAVGVNETSVLTATKTFRSARAYLMRLTGMVNSSVAGKAPLIRFRKTNPAGTQLDVSRVYCPTAQTYNSAFEAHFIVGAVDIAATIAVTIQADATFNTQLTASANSPASLTIYDVGDAADYPWAPSI